VRALCIGKMGIAGGAWRHPWQYQLQ
jgi:hypothetical protein